MEFSFSLFADSPEYYSTEEKTATLDPNNTLGFGKFSGDLEGVHLGFVPDGGHTLSGSIIENKGNFEAGVKILDTSGIENNYYINITNGLKYGVSGVASHRTIDTTKKPTEIRDGGQLSNAERLVNSTGFLLSP